MAKQVKVLTAKPDDPSSTLGPHGGRKGPAVGLSSDLYMHAIAQVPSRAHIK